MINERTLPTEEPRDIWLSREGRVLYNSLGAEVMDVLESTTDFTAQAEIPTGSLDDAALRVGELVERLSNTVEELVHEMNPQSGLDFHAREGASTYLLNESLGVGQLRPVDVMLAEGMTTGFVMPAKLTLLALRRSGKEAGVGAEVISKSMNSQPVRSLAISASDAAPGFWNAFSGVDRSPGEDVGYFNMVDIEEDFVSAFNEQDSKIESLDQLLGYDPGKGVAFTELAKATMRLSKESYNSTHPPEERTSGCPVTLGRLSVGENEQSFQHRIIVGDFGPKAAAANRTKELLDESGAFEGHESVVAFDPLISRLTRYLANTIHPNPVQ